VKRITKELKTLDKHNLENVSGQQVGDDIFQMQGTINGPEGTPYEDGIFFLNIQFPKDYPFKPPKVEFQTKIYHMNVDPKGGICLPMLKDEWSPALNIIKVLEAIYELLSTPNPSSPLRAEIAELYTKDKAAHDKAAKDETHKFAM